MNGRVYDPLIGRFGSADPMTENPYSTQGWNRYSYVGNSPLNFTDPSGYCFMGCFWQAPFKALGALFNKIPILGALLRIAAPLMCGPGAIVCAGIVASLSSAFVAGVTSGKFSVALRAGLIAAASAVALYQVGQLTDHNPAFGTSKHLANIAGHAAVGCATSVASGGKCGPDAAAGAVGSFGAPFVSANVKGDFVGGTVASSVLGGLGALAGGGKFENGAVTGAFGYLFNEMGDHCQRGHCGEDGEPWKAVTNSGEAHGTWAAEIIGGAIVAVGYGGYRAYRFVSDLLEFRRVLNSAGEGDGGTVTLYHHGDLSGGVNGSRSISLSPSSELSHYGSGNLHSFQVPRRVLNEWESNGWTMRGLDLHQPTGIRTPEIRVYPPASGQLNRYLMR